VRALRAEGDKGHEPGSVWTAAPAWQLGAWVPRCLGGLLAGSWMEPQRPNQTID
jgi:hypothetical protein